MNENGLLVITLKAARVAGELGGERTMAYGALFFRFEAHLPNRAPTNRPIEEARDDAHLWADSRSLLIISYTVGL